MISEALLHDDNPVPAEPQVRAQQAARWQTESLPPEHSEPTSDLPADVTTPPSGSPRPPWRLSLALFLATCASTFLIGGPAYALSIMTILGAHEMGHYVQARRYGVPASLPYFIPFPLTAFGTLGALIVMRSRNAGNRALFDLAITGPLAGIGPAILLSAIGLRLSTVKLLEETEQGNYLSLGEPLIFKLLSYLTLGPLEEGTTVVLHPIAFAGWVGIFITALNLLPIGQLDGGHILYTLVPAKAHMVSKAILGIAIGAIALDAALGWSLAIWPWSLMITILLLMGVRHPPTAYGSAPINRKRRLLGWATLLFVLVGFTPTPLVI